AQLLVRRAQWLSGQAAERRELRAAPGRDDARRAGRVAPAAERRGTANRMGFDQICETGRRYTLTPSFFQRETGLCGIGRWRHVQCLCLAGRRTIFLSTTKRR